MGRRNRRASRRREEWLARSRTETSRHDPAVSTAEGWSDRPKSARIVVQPWKWSRLRFSERIARKTERTGAGPLAAARARAGEFVLGRCTMREASWHCKDCDHTWPKRKPMPSEGEDLAFGLRWERHCRRPDVFLRIIGGEAVVMVRGLNTSAYPGAFARSLRSGVVHRKIKLKDCGTWKGRLAHFTICAKRPRLEYAYGP